MKFYNPFKPHIVEFENGKFAVRKSALIHWLYKGHTLFTTEKEEHWWFLHEYVVKHCMVNTLNEARDVLNRDNPKIKKVNECAVKAVHEA